MTIFDRQHVTSY